MSNDAAARTRGETAPNGEDGVQWRLEVRPALTDEEAAALVVVLLALDAHSAPVTPEVENGGPSSWTMAGRHAARSGITGGSRTGWGRQVKRQ